jgi:hypothetical protein
MENKIDNKEYEKKYIQLFNYDNWYPLVQDITFKQKRLFPSRMILIPLFKNEVEEFVSSGLPFNLKRKIENRFDVCKGSKWFARLSTKSPKDSKYFFSPITTSDEIIKLFETSQICINDMISFVNGTYDNLSIVLLPWINYSKKHELRCFVHKNKLVAITQPYLGYWSSDNSIDKQKVVDDIRLIVNGIKLFLNFDSYVLDIEVTSNYKIIEFNPYYEHGLTSTLLFSWKLDHDRLFGKKKGVEIRLHTTDGHFEQYLVN